MVHGRTMILFITILPILTIFNPPTVQAGISYPIIVTDDFGRSVTINSPPNRIVSTAPSNTEILFTLGLGDKVVGVTKYCDWPPTVPERVKQGKITVIGGYADPSLEGVVSLKPDLVVAATNLQREFVSALQNMGVTVVGLNPRNIDEVVNNIRLIGTICNRTMEANRLAENLQMRLSYVSEKTLRASKPKVYYELWYDPLMSFGGNTFVDDLIQKAGGENIFHDSPAPYPIIDAERVIQKNPDIIIVPIGYMGGVSKSDFGKRPGWNMIEAVKKDRIYQLNEDTLIRPGPRLFDGLEYLAAAIHPELFTGTINYTKSISVTSNSTVFALIYDDSRSLLNFTIIGKEGTVASISVTIEKRLLRGRPIVLIDGLKREASISEDQASFTVRFNTGMSRREVVIGGSETIPEFKVIHPIIFLAILITFLVLRPETGRIYRLSRFSLTRP
ncbi:MAG: ABC transporter substrate-binding protein [Candidatus Bathyarchaeia archaeon]